jgi:hypothetical protein
MPGKSDRKPSEIPLCDPILRHIPAPQPSRKQLAAWLDQFAFEHDNS